MLFLEVLECFFVSPFFAFFFAFFFSFFFALLLCLLAVAPWMVPAALGALQVDATTPIEWVPVSFAPRAAYEKFTGEFQSGDVVIASWDGCMLDAPAIDAFRAAASGPEAPRAPDGEPWFEPIASGGVALARIAMPTESGVAAILRY